MISEYSSLKVLNQATARSAAGSVPVNQPSKLLNTETRTLPAIGLPPKFRSSLSVQAEGPINGLSCGRLKLEIVRLAYAHHLPCLLFDHLRWRGPHRAYRIVQGSWLSTCRWCREVAPLLGADTRYNFKIGGPRLYDTPTSPSSRYWPPTRV